MLVIYNNSVIPAPFAWDQFSVRCLKSINQPPVQPYDPFPLNGIQDQSFDVILSWSCSDPENQPLTYDVYFSDETPPSLVSAGQSETFFDPNDILIPGTTYYWKIVAYDNLNQFNIGSEWSFTTQNEGIPIVTTGEVTNIGIHTAEASGNVTDQGSSSVTARGVCWSLNQNPTISDNFTVSGTGLGTFYSQLTNLYTSSSYYLRAYATNSQGTGYGTQLTFKTSHEHCPGLPTILYDGQIYNTVQIGTQCWLKENLNVGSIGFPGNNSTIEKFCYDNLPINCDIYGGLYTWYEAMQYTYEQGTQGICPDGWHIPSFSDWQLLIDTLGGNEIAGCKVKETGTSHWNYPNTNSNNESGFTALPGGYLNYDFGAFQGLRSHGFFHISGAIYNSNSYCVLDGSSFFYIINFIGSARMPVYDVSKIQIYPQLYLQTRFHSDGAQNQPINTILSWTCTDPENDPITYDVYLSSSNPPSLMSTGQTGNTLNPGALAYNTLYYWKIVAHDDHSNNTEGPVWSFSTKTAFECGDPLVDSRDGQTYTTVQIGTQCWMTENLNIGTMIPGANQHGKQQHY